MPDFVTVCKEADLPIGAARRIQISGTEIAVYNVGGKFYATQQECLHRQGPLDEGKLEGAIVTCPWHGWQYDVTTGEKLRHRAQKLKTYAVTAEGGEIKIEV
jgi:nitrite reductase/ring-hydroxylating ferredoxin subunit